MLVKFSLSQTSSKIIVEISPALCFNQHIWLCLNEKRVPDMSDRNTNANLHLTLEERRIILNRIANEISTLEKILCRGFLKSMSIFCSLTGAPTLPPHRQWNLPQMAQTHKGLLMWLHAVRSKGFTEKQPYFITLNPSQRDWSVRTRRDWQGNRPEPSRHPCKLHTRRKYGSKKSAGTCWFFIIS